MGETYIRLASIFPLFVPAIRDYIDVLNNAYDSVLSDINLQQIIYQSFLFFISSIKFTIIYFLSFQWVQDLSYLPILVPQLKIEILKEHFFLQTPESNFFTFLEIPSYTNNKFLLGIFNSFFLCLPLSVAHIISTRRLLIQGLYAGISANLGTIFGQILLLICILFGGRFFITPWFNFQILNYVLGLFLVLNIVYDMAHERSIRIIDISNTSVLIKIFLLNFALAWTEQSCIFQYFGNLTLGAEPTIIEIFSSSTELQSILTHITYILGITIGSFIFTSIFIFICLKISNFVVQLSSIRYSRWIRRLNFSLLTLILAFSFTSIPFYSFDYLILSNLGFVSQDKNFQNTVFLPTKIHDVSPLVLGDARNLSLDKKPGIDTDVALFDKGRYLMFDANDSFEQFNYQGEYAWLVKKHRTPTVSRDPSSSKVLSNFSKLFQKMKKTSRSTSKTSITSNDINLKLDFKNQDQKKKIDSNKNSKIDYDKSMTILHSRNENEHKINEFFESLINSSLQNRFIISPESKKPILEKNFKQKYYSNPIYKLLLNTDIDFFLNRQPNSFALNAKQENELFEKRLVLGNYYDSLRYYNTLPYKDEFQDVFHGSKSYADRIYNQQFKGTLKIVRRLFSISFNNSEEKLQQNSDLPKNNFLSDSRQNTQKNKNKLVLKFDQPLYKNSNTTKLKNNKFNLEYENNNVHGIFHEEFFTNRKTSLNKNSTNSNLHNADKIDAIKANTAFIQMTNPIPFYVGWDEQLRKLVITNRLSPRYSAGYSMKFLNKNYSNDYPSLQKIIQKNKTIEFTAWPIQNNNVKNTKNKSTPSYNILFDSLLNLKNKSMSEEFVSLKQREDSNDFGTLESLPINIAKNGGKMDQKLQDIIPYTRGGFVWPGHLNLKFNFKNFF